MDAPNFSEAVDAVAMAVQIFVGKQSRPELQPLLQKFVPGTGRGPEVEQQGDRGRGVVNQKAPHPEGDVERGGGSF